MVEHNDASEDDVESVESVEKLDQVTFWTLTLSFLLKLVAFGITAFTLPFNEWITLEQHQLKDESIIEIIRGISGSDCILPNRLTKEILCSRWNDLHASRVSFWRRWDIEERNVQPPSAAFELLYYLVVLQLALYTLDLGTTFVMCYRYKFQKNEMTKEKRMATVVLGVTFFILAIVSLTVVGSSGLFILVVEDGGTMSYKSHIGAAVKLYISASLIYLASFFLANASRIATMRQRGVAWKAVFRELLLADLRLPGRRRTAAGGRCPAASSCLRRRHDASPEEPPETIQLKKARELEE